MTIELYNTNSKQNEINKILENKKTIECLLKNRVNYTDINLLLDYSIDDFNFNYIYIPNFKRYFFIKNIEIVRENLVNITLHIDVLMTYKEKFLNVECRIIESENNINENFSTVEKNQNYNVKKLEIETNFINTDNKLVLVTQK